MKYAKPTLLGSINERKGGNKHTPRITSRRRQWQSLLSHRIIDLPTWKEEGAPPGVGGWCCPSLEVQPASQILNTIHNPFDPDLWLVVDLA